MNGNFIFGSRSFDDSFICVWEKNSEDILFIDVLQEEEEEKKKIKKKFFFFFNF